MRPFRRCADGSWRHRSACCGTPSNRDRSALDPCRSHLHRGVDDSLQLGRGRHLIPTFEGGDATEQPLRICRLVRVVAVLTCTPICCSAARASSGVARCCCWPPRIQGGPRLVVATEVHQGDTTVRGRWRGGRRRCRPACPGRRGTGHRRSSSRCAGGVVDALHVPLAGLSGQRHDRSVDGLIGIAARTGDLPDPWCRARSCRRRSSRRRRCLRWFAGTAPSGTRRGLTQASARAVEDRAIERVRLFSTAVVHRPSPHACTRRSARLSEGSRWGHRWPFRQYLRPGHVNIRRRNVQLPLPNRPCPARGWGLDVRVANVSATITNLQIADQALAFTLTVTGDAGGYASR